MSVFSSLNSKLNGKTCLGRITDVDGTSRTVKCKTIGLAGVTDDQYLHSVKVLHAAWHVEGDEETYLPRVGSYAVITFINSEPYILGYYPLSITAGDQQRKNQETLQPGDKIIKTLAGNKLFLHSGGATELSATPGCRTLWIPSHNIINTICQNLEIEPAGGLMHWTLDPEVNDTLMKFQAYDNVDVATMVQLEIGTVDTGVGTAPVVDLAIGPPTSDVSDIETRNFQFQVEPDGSAHLEVGPVNMTLDIAADGTTEINIGPSKLYLKMAPDGTVLLETFSDITIKCDGNVAATVKGDTTITTTGNTNVTTDGDTTVTTSGDTTIDTSGKTTVQSGADVDVTAGGNANIKASGNAKVDAAAISLNGQSGQVLTTMTQPLVDNITGQVSVGVPTVSAG